METVLSYLGIPIAITIVWIGVAFADRIGSDEVLELRALRKEKARLEAELEKCQQGHACGSK